MFSHKAILVRRAALAQTRCFKWRILVCTSMDVELETKYHDSPKRYRTVKYMYPIVL
jgi:hypothetical protein